MPTFTIPVPHDVTPSAPFTPGATLSPKEGISFHLGTAPYNHVVHERTVYTYSLPRSSRTQLPKEIDEFPGAQVMSHLYLLNEIFQHSAAQACEAVICAMPQILQDTPFPLMQLSWEPQSFSHRCNCVNVGLSNPLEPNYFAVVDIHFEMGGPVYTQVYNPKNE